jgi:hypothetical protein
MSDKGLTQGPKGQATSYSHGKGKLPNQSIPSPDANAGHSKGKGSGSQDLGAGKGFSKGSINHTPNKKGPGTPMGLTSAKAKGLPQPFNDAGTRG